MLGPPGAGKGTQAEGLSAHCHIPKISTGDMLRAVAQQGTTIGKQAKSIMDTGELVSDGLMLALVRERIEQDDCGNGYLLDGFPRTLTQAQGLDAMADIDFVLHIDVTDVEIIKRLSGRRVHAASGRAYHMLTQPPAVKDQDDLTGEPLIQRDDDREETIQNRLKVYKKSTHPLVDYYASQHKSGRLCYAKVSGLGTVSEIQNRLQTAINA